ncbi:MAG: hypothetical protein ACREA9_17855 [Pyrinomonadaceae bacterium]
MLEEPSAKRNDDPRVRQPSPTFQAESNRLDLGKLELLRRWSQYAAVVVLVVFIVLIGLSWIQLRRINDEVAAADENLEKKKVEITQLKIEADNLQAKISGLQKVTGALTDVTRSLGDRSPEQAEKIKQAVEDSIGSTNDLAQIPARIYIQIGREDQRKRAGDVARKLQAQGFVVPGLEQKKGQGVENVRGLSPRVSQIRYYQANEVSQKDLNDIVGLLRGMGIELKQVQLPASKLVRPRHYEIWFGEDF